MARIRLPVLTKEQIFHQLLEAMDKELRSRVCPLININQEWEQTQDIVCEWDASIYEVKLDQQNQRNTYRTPQSKPQSQHRPRNDFNKERISTTNRGHNNETNGNLQVNQQIEVRLGTPTRIDNNRDKKEILTETKINSQTRRIAEHAITVENQDIYRKTVEVHQCSQQQLL